MAPVMLENRVESLEDLMRDLIRSGKQVDRQLKETAQQQKITDHLLKSLIQQQDITHQEVTQLSKEMRASKKEMDKRWGELSNKMGTLVEDLVAPSISGIFKTLTNCLDEDIREENIRTKRRHPLTNKLQEFDAIVISNDYVLINETKSRLTTENIKDFKNLMTTAREYFPNHKDKKFIGAIASLYIDYSVVTYAEKQGLVVLGFMEGAMQILNKADFILHFF